MTSEVAERLLDNFVFRIASFHGFTRIESLRYGCPKHDATAMLSFPFRVSSRGSGLFTMWVGLRFESLAPWLEDDRTKTRPTFVRPIHFLRENRTYTEWEFSNAENLEKLKDAILSDFQRYALPFAERYSELTELRKTVEDVKASVSIGIDVDRRVLILAAMKLVEGDRAGALKTLDLALLERATAFPKRRYAMEYLRKKITGQV